MKNSKISRFEAETPEWALRVPADAGGVIKANSNAATTEHTNVTAEQQIQVASEVAEQLPERVAAASRQSLLLTNGGRIIPELLVKLKTASDLLGTGWC